MEGSSRNGRPVQTGDVFWVSLSGVENEQRGVRPCVVFQNGVGNAFSPNVIVFPLTSSLKRSDFPTHVLVSAEESGLKLDSVVLCENPVCVSKQRLGRFITHLSDGILSKIAVAHLLSTAALALVDADKLQQLRVDSIKLHVA